MLAEIELKAELSAAGARAVRARLQASHGEGALARLTTAYLDTADDQLARAGIALRVRREGGRRIVTVKAGRSSLGGLQSATEWEGPLLARLGPVRSIRDAELARRVADMVADGPLATRFETQVKRRRWHVRGSCGTAEVALDDGRVKAAGRKARFHEIELELLEGSPEVLYEIGKTLIADVPAWPGSWNKAARGARCLGGTPPIPDPPAGAAPRPASGAAQEEAFRQGLRHLVDAACVSHWLIHMSEGAAGPHQFRVTLRRLRAFLRLHAGLVDRDVRRTLTQRARDLARCVGALRDHDVLGPDFAARAARSGDERLHAALLASHRRTRSAVRRALLDGQSTGFLLDLGRLAALGGWRARRAPRRPGPIEACRARIEQRWTKLAREADRLAVLDAEGRHEVRKAAKMIRYMLDGVPGVDRSFVARFKKFQQDLGDLNDAAVASGWTGCLRRRDDRDALERLKRQARAVADTDRLLGRTARHWAMLSAQWPPWREARNR